MCHKGHIMTSQLSEPTESVENDHDLACKEHFRLYSESRHFKR